MYKNHPKRPSCPYLVPSNENNTNKISSKTNSNTNGNKNSNTLNSEMIVVALYAIAHALRVAPLCVMCYHDAGAF